MRLTRIRYGNVPPFTEPVDISFDERVNVFVGPNATGKSRLLSAIDGRFNDKEAVREWHTSPSGHLPSYENYPLDLLYLTIWQEEHLSDDWVKGNALCADRELSEAHFRSKPALPVIYLGPTRVGLPGISELGELDSYGSTAEEVLSGPFSGERLRAAIDTLYLKADRMSEQERQDDLPTDDRKAWHFWYIESVAHSCARSICDELFTSTRGR